VLRTLLGEALRTTRLRQERTLREVSSAARVSLGYLSEVERGRRRRPPSCSPPSAARWA
jgi:transcriptional regulator with XRE-family HTH domain